MTSHVSTPMNNVFSFMSRVSMQVAVGVTAVSLNVSKYMSRVSTYMSHVSTYTSHVSTHMSHVSKYMSHVATHAGGWCGSSVSKSLFT